MGKRLILAILIGLAARTAAAEKMDIETHSLVINKLERAVSQLEKGDASRYPILLRLGDLFAERARLVAMQEVAKNCQACTESRQDRRRAIQYYQTVFNNVDQERKGKILIQMAHLHEVLNEPAKAVELYEKVIKAGRPQYSGEMIGQSYAGLGDIYFRKGKFAEALFNFQRALAYKETKNRGYITYRLAWSYLNSGRQHAATQALLSILENPELLARESANGPEVNQAFHEDVARDLATFLARGPVGAKELRTLLAYTPDSARKDTLFYFAGETERLGQPAASLLVWRAFLQEPETTPIERLEAQVRMAQMQFDLGKKQAAIDEMAKAIETWRKQGCEDKEKCPPLKSRLAKLVTDWNRQQKKNPSPVVFQAYALYTSLFNDDIEMHYLGAIVARDLNQPAKAIPFYRRASLLAAVEIKQKPNHPEMANLKRIFEESLLGEIAMAETSKDPQVREDAYNHYLKMNPEGPQKQQVLYQRARAYYDRGQYKAAADEFRAIALRSGERGLRQKAADLALDALALLKDDKALEKWALEFAREFPHNRAEYTRISRKATLNLVAGMSNDPGASASDQAEALDRLNAVPLAGATDDERISLLKSKLILSEKARDFRTAEKTADQLLTIRKLSREDREWALSRKVWIAEVQFDFATAYAVSLKMSHPKLKDDARELRLAMLAELSGRDPSRHLEAYLKASRDRSKSEQIRAKLVRLARNPAREFQKQRPYLARNPELTAALALEIFAKTRDLRLAEETLRLRGAKRTVPGQTLSRFVFMKDYKRAARALSSHRLRAGSDRLLQKSLKDRLDLLRKSEKLAQKAVDGKDWILQLVTLGDVAMEYDRFYQEILSLPAPRGLNQAQKREYLALLSQQAQPYQAKAQQVAGKVRQFWSNEKALSLMIEGYTTSKQEIKPALGEQIQWVAANAPSETRSRLNQILVNPADRPNPREVQLARRELKQDPFSLDKALNLKKLEEKSGSDTMVAYLDGRIHQLNKGEKR